MNIYWVDVIFILLIQVAKHLYVDSYLLQVHLFSLICYFTQDWYLLYVNYLKSVI